ncbi:heme-binding protein [Roseovarius sp. EL26]|uniref:GlcG/HbpS family heme-binding protein n=1 Tax=Roseovarius sp. EL26 TaxID=2126672 RepID=UPI000EA1A7EF|nr:heme-binding protein [Roseovarius sp. EL26]
MTSTTQKLVTALGFAMAAGQAAALDCSDLPDHAALTEALKASTASTSETINGGLELNMWVSLVNRDGEICAIAMTGDDRGDQWPGSRVISAQKANTANAFSLPGLALSTANLYSATQPGGSLFGLQFSNPVNPQIAYGDATAYGTENDPLVGQKLGGVNVFGGGLALYDAKGVLLGAIGVSGDTSCADHNIAWRTRDALQLGNVPAGVSANGDDGILYDINEEASASGFGHPVCGGGEVAVAIKIGAGQ